MAVSEKTLPHFANMKLFQSLFRAHLNSEPRTCPCKNNTRRFQRITFYMRASRRPKLLESAITKAILNWQPFPLLCIYITGKKNELPIPVFFPNCFSFLQKYPGIGYNKLTIRFLVFLGKTFCRTICFGEKKAFCFKNKFEHTVPRDYVPFACAFLSQFDVKRIRCLGNFFLKRKRIHA